MLTRFFKTYDCESKQLIAIGTGSGGVEITEAEYNNLLSMIREKAALVDKLYSGEIAIADVPAEWHEEIQRRVDKRIERDGEAGQQEISAEEALNIILGGETV